MNNKLATETCVDYKINSKANEITDVRNYKSYSSVTQLGLTRGSATPTALFNAMPNISFYFGNATEFATSSVPSIYGSVFIIKKEGYKGWADFHGNSAGLYDYRMYPQASDGSLDGTWYCIGGDSGLKQLTTQTITSGSIYYQKKNGFVYVTFESIVIGTTSTVVAGNLPSGYRPSYNAQPYLRRAGNGIVQCWIGTNGDIHMASSNASEQCAGFVVYPCN